jgi:MSHA biogenesis protein MshE
VIAQRLIRRVCSNCKEPHQPTSSERALIASLATQPTIASDFVHGKGCAFCSNTGYRGRIGVFELLEMTPEMADAMRRSNPADFATASNLSEGFVPFTQVALEYARQGITTLEEVVRVAGEIADTPDEIPATDLGANTGTDGS